MQNLLPLRVTGFLVYSLLQPEKSNFANRMPDYFHGCPTSQWVRSRFLLNHFDEAYSALENVSRYRSTTVAHISFEMRMNATHLPGQWLSISQCLRGEVYLILLANIFFALFSLACIRCGLQKRIAAHPSASSRAVNGVVCGDLEK